MLSCDSSGTSDLKFWDWCVNSRNAGKKEGGKEGQPWGSWIKTNPFQNTELSAYWTLWHVDTSTLPTSVASGSCFWGQLCFPVFVIFRAWAWVTAQAIFFNFFFILARILFQTSLWLWEPNKVTHWGRHWSSGSLRGGSGQSWSQKRRLKNLNRLREPGTARRDICSHNRSSLGFLEECGKPEKQTHTPEI